MSTGSRVGRWVFSCTCLALVLFVLKYGTRIPKTYLKCFQQCCGSGMFPGSDFFPSAFRDPGSEFFHPGSRIRIKEFKYFNPKKWFLSSRKYDPGCSSRIRIRILTFYPSPIPDPGVKKAPDPGSGSATLAVNQHSSRGSVICFKHSLIQLQLKSIARAEVLKYC
jgi:hypothetical protein